MDRGRQGEREEGFIWLPSELFIENGDSAKNLQKILQKRLAADWLIC